jgi:hypothetical protein
MTKQERDTWAIIYHLYDEFVPGLRQAAALEDDGGLNQQLFSAARAKIELIYDSLDDDCRVLLLAGYSALEDVFLDAQKRARTRAQAPAVQPDQGRQMA